MDSNDKKISFQIDGLIQLKKVGDYLKLVDKKVKLLFKETDSKLKTKKILSANVVALTDTGTHLVLENVCVKKYVFFSMQIQKSVVPIDNISTVQILDKFGKPETNGHKKK